MTIIYCSNLFKQLLQQGFDLTKENKGAKA